MDPAVVVGKARSVVVVVVALLGLDVVFNGLISLVDYAGRPTKDQLVLVALVGLAYLGFFIATVVIYCIWLYRSIKAINLMSSRPFPYSPGFAVGYHFIPFANLYRPFQVMQAAFRWASPESVSPITKLILWLWWLLWILSGVFQYASTQSADAQGGMIGATMEAASAGLLIYIVINLTTLLENKLREWQTERMNQAPPVGFVEYPRPTNPTAIS